MPPSDATVAMQMQIAHLERFVEQLNEVVTSQGLQLDRQRSELDRLLKTMDELKTKSNGPGTPSLEDEKPPHY